MYMHFETQYPPSNEEIDEIQNAIKKPSDGVNLRSADVTIIGYSEHRFWDC